MTWIGAGRAGSAGSAPRSCSISRVALHPRAREVDAFQAAEIEVDPLDTRRFGAAGIVGVEPGVVEIRRGGYRVGRGPRRADHCGSIRAAQDGDLVAAVHQTLRDVQQRADVPDR